VGRVMEVGRWPLPMKMQAPRKASSIKVESSAPRTGLALSSTNVGGLRHGDGITRLKSDLHARAICGRPTFADRERFA
jgi:hypothetical protein